MDPALIGAGVGLLSSLFGSKPSVPTHVLEQYRLLNSLIGKGINLYDSTNFEELDAQAVQKMWDGAMQRGQTLLGNYDARAAGAGSPGSKEDTKKDRARNQIAADTTLPVAQFEAGLIGSRPLRQAQLLPNPGNVAMGFQPAQYLDAQAYGENEAQMTGLMNAASMLSKLFGKKGASASSAGRNDRYQVGGDNYQLGGGGFVTA